MTEYKIGVVTYYYAQMGMAIVDLSGSLHVDDRIRISGSVEFSQAVEVIKMEHELVESAVSGDTIGLKVIRPVLPGDEIIKSEL